MDARVQKAPAATARGAAVLLIGVALAAWIVFGRFLFGIGGELTLAYGLIGALVAVLHVFIGRALARTAARGFPTRGATRGTLIAAWGCGVLLGLTIPDLTRRGLQTIISGDTEPGLGVAIGVANPAGIIMTALTIIALVLATQDSRGPRPADEDL